MTIEGVIDQSWQSTVRDRVRIAAIHRESRRIFNKDTGAWVQLPDDTGMEPEEAWALDLPHEVAQAVYQALRRHFGDDDLETVRALIKAREASETRRVYLESAMTKIALRTTEEAE